MDALRTLSAYYIPVVAIEALAINHLLAGAVFKLDVGSVSEAALQAHLRLQQLHYF